MVKWRPWPPIQQTRKFEVKLVVCSLHVPEVGSSIGREGPLAVEVRWKGRPRTPLVPLRRSVRKNCTRGVQVPLHGGELVEWNEDFFCICDLVGPKDGAFYPWEVALTVFNERNGMLFQCHIDGTINEYFYNNILMDAGGIDGAHHPFRCVHCQHIDYKSSHFDKILDDGSRNKISIVGIASLNLGEYALAAQEKEIVTSIPLLLTDAAIHGSAFSLNLALGFVELGTSQQSSELMPKTVTLVQLSLGNEDTNCTDKDGLANTKPHLTSIQTFKRSMPGGKSTKSARDSSHNDRRSPVRINSSENPPFDMDSLDGGLDDGESEDDQEVCGIAIYSYGTLAAANHVGGSFYIEMVKNGKYDDWVYYSHHGSKSNCSHIEKVSTTDPTVSSQTSRTFLPWKKRRMSFKSPKCKGEPLLKCYGEEGGDDIDFDRRTMSPPNESLKNLGGDAPENNSSISKFGDDNFAVGKWERREILSRNGELKLCTQIFFASIDQRSEQAAGESACTALVAVIADWIKTNPDIMPTQSEFDNLIREGSLEWRNLCSNETYREKFPDKHFDLETVLQAKVRPLSIVPERSTVGFFHPEGVANDNPRFEFLRGALSFDDIWNEISQDETNPSSNRFTSLYIVSWNDHFFILKVEPEAYYIIDTLGERLFEGCKQAYVLKFDKDTEIQKVARDGSNASRKDKRPPCETSKQKQHESQDAVEGSEAHAGSRDDEDDRYLCKGKESCKEYIKNFLAMIPIQELLVDLKKGLMASTPLHQVLQVDFHYTELSKPVVVEFTQPKASELVMDSTPVESPAS